jgi:hypothetical protein
MFSGLLVLSFRVGGVMRRGGKVNLTHRYMASAWRASTRPAGPLLRQAASVPDTSFSFEC